MSDSSDVCFWESHTLSLTAPVPYFPFCGDAACKGRALAVALTAILRSILNSRPSLAIAALLCAAVALGGCASRHIFQQGNRPESQYQSDVRYCQQRAEGRVASAENYAERYENGSDSEIIGAGIGAMLATADRGAGHYNRCMKQMGYRQ